MVNHNTIKLKNTVDMWINKTFKCFDDEFKHSSSSVFYSADVKLTHRSNEMSQDNVIMFQGPFVLMGFNKQ